MAYGPNSQPDRIDFSKYRANFGYHGRWAFRVTSDSRWRKRYEARQNRAPPGRETVRRHLLGLLTANSPWVSLYTNWAEALAFANQCRRNGEKNVIIMIFDMSKVYKTNSILDSQLLACDLNLDNPQRYRNELLVHKYISCHAHVATIRVNGNNDRVWTRGDRLVVPKRLADFRNQRWTGEIESWVLNEVQEDAGGSEDYSLESMNGFHASIAAVDDQQALLNLRA